MRLSWKEINSLIPIAEVLKKTFIPFDRAKFRRPIQTDIQEREIWLGSDGMDAADKLEDSRVRSHSHDTDPCHFIVHFHVSWHVALNGFCGHVN